MVGRQLRVIGREFGMTRRQRTSGEWRPTGKRRPSHSPLAKLADEANQCGRFAAEFERLGLLGQLVLRN